MLATMPSVSPQAQCSMSTPVHAEDDRNCAGCSRSVSSETGGVVVAFGNSLWHVDCFKCAKCGNQVNADTNLLLLSDGSPVCANCYNCKVCKLPILDEAVMTGDDSFHAECFTCRSCKNRIDELVFAKTSQGFYCMKCHNERVARSRRHIAKQKQRERAALGSAGGRSVASAGDSSTRSRENDDNRASTPSDAPRAKYASGGSSTDGHFQAMSSSQTGSGSRLSHSSRPDEMSVAPDPSSGIGDTVDPTPIDHPVPEIRSASPAPPAVSVTVAGPSSASAVKAEYSRTRANSRGQANTAESGPSFDGPPPPPYSASPPPISANSDVESARSSASYAYNASSTVPTSPSVSVSVSHEGSSSDGASCDRPSSLVLPSSDSGSRARADSLTPREHGAEGSPSSGWPGDVEQEGRRKSHDDGTRPLSAYLQPKPNGVAALTVSKKRDKRGSINPGLQLEASKMFQLQAQRPGSPNASSPSSPPAPAASGSYVRSQSPTTLSGGRDSPRVTSPLRDYFVGIDDDSSGSTAFYSPSASPQPVHPDSPTSPRKTSGPSQIPTASTSNLTPRFPLRTDSLRGAEAPAAPAAPLSSAPRVTGLPGSPYNGKLPRVQSPLLNARGSFDEHGGRLSPRNAGFDIDAGRRSRSVSPVPPDVPRSIESGTDTETDTGNDSDDIMKSYMDMVQDDALSKSQATNPPPPPPPKDAKSSNIETRVRSPIQPSSEPSSAGPADGEDFFQEKDNDDGPSISSVTERTSGFFIAPALPPMRFSMNGTDFRELLVSLGGASPSKRLSVIPGLLSDTNTASIPEEKAEEVATAKTPTSVASTITPLAGSTSTTTTSQPLSSGTERKRSMKGRKAVPPDLLPTRMNGERTDSAPPSATSPITPSRPDLKKRSPHRSSKNEPLTRVLDDMGSPRSSGESRRPSSPRTISAPERMNSLGALESASSQIPVISVPRSGPSRQEAAELVTRRLKEALTDANERSADYIKLDRAFVEAIISSLDHRREQVHEMSSKLDGMKRTSQMMFDGLSVAQEEYNQEVAARHNAETEVSRLKIELSGHAARITALSGDDRRHEVQKQLTKELSDNLSGLEQDLSKLKVERDMTLAEVEELSASKSSAPNGDIPVAAVSRSLTMRLDNIKRQYQHELVPLTQQREALVREILELKEARDIFLEETAVLNARNEELAQLNTQYERRLEVGHSREKSLPSVQQPAQSKAAFVDTWKTRQTQAPPIVNTTSTSSSATLIDEIPESRGAKPMKTEPIEMPSAQRTRFRRWPGNKANKDALNGNPFAADSGKAKKGLEHAFQQLSILRFARCDLCGEKMWGSQVRCSACNLAVHVRCVGQVQTSCTHDGASEDHLPAGPPPPSMFGRDLIEQVREDSKTSELFVPIIVEKCIEAVEALALDYEGVYRKSGGTGQSKAITSLFERGDYDAFDLCDSDAFNDISSVTSVLKNYFRMLPNPLLTHGMHDAFVAAGSIKDPQIKGQALKDLVKQLPAEHYHTLNCLMLHLHKVQSKADVNLMTARNLGVIFGPTLMRSSDPSREFSDMAGKSFAIEYLIENAPSVFPPLSS
ncbi:hypothetical protein M0805_000755 [Coniferiporia weirii]|nr:hypothetical protein M0805_000755 [Coniferiporia weirii]